MTDRPARERLPAFPPDVAERLRELGRDGRLDLLRAIATGEEAPRADDGALASLVEHGLLVLEDEPARRVARPDATALFTLAEALRSVADRSIRRADEPAAGADGPRLLLVHGAPLGRRFAVPRLADPETPIVIGRGSRADVPVEADPYVSARHAALFLVGSVAHVLDLGSRNGTTLNWTPLPRERAIPLADGDLVGVGRSLLLYRA